MTLCSPIDCSLPGTSIHGIFQATVLEWVAISFSIRDWRLSSKVFWTLSGSGSGSGSPTLSNAPTAESCWVSPGVGGGGQAF